MKFFLPVCIFFCLTFATQSQEKKKEEGWIYPILVKIEENRILFDLKDLKDDFHYLNSNDEWVTAKKAASFQLVRKPELVQVQFSPDPGIPKGFGIQLVMSREGTWLTVRFNPREYSILMPLTAPKKK